jgi:hypothetical protein
MTAEVELDWRKNPVLREWAEELAEIISEERINERVAEELRKIRVRQISARFGFIPDSVRDRIQAASVPQLEEWFKNLIGASTLDELLQLQQ